MVYDEKSLGLIRDRLISSQQTLAVAESVSAGHLQAAFSAAPDANCFFQGGITTYNLGQKTRLLDVEPIHALACDCVSQEVTEQMARKICALFLSNYGIAITGYATPCPKKELKRFMHGCVSYTKEISSCRKRSIRVIQKHMKRSFIM